MIYKTSLDNLAKAVTIGTSILFAIIIGVQFSYYNEKLATAQIFTIALLTITYLGTFLFRPVNYQLTNNELIIHRPLKDIRFERKEIKTVENLDKDSLKRSIRTFGVGGLFGYWGRFANSKLGTMTWYATRRSNAVLVTTVNNKKLILTPDEPDKFVNEFNAKT